MVVGEVSVEGWGAATVAVAETEGVFVEDDILRTTLSETEDENEGVLECEPVATLSLSEIVTETLAVFEGDSDLEDDTGSPKLRLGAGDDDKD